MFTPWDLLWFFFIFSSLQPVVQKYLLAQARRRTLAKIAMKRDATVITLIHRQETLSLLGIPLARYIDIDDSQSVLRAIRETPPGKTIEIILHTPGGLVLAASQIARALGDHDGRVVAVVPHYAMSGGTLIALATPRSGRSIRSSVSTRHGRWSTSRRDRDVTTIGPCCSPTLAGRRSGRCSGPPRCCWRSTWRRGAHTTPRSCSPPASGRTITR
jgi:hypothetical protein